MSETAIVVAVDGPSGSGKSSVCRAVAARFGYDYLDTGAMYRAVRWWCAHAEIDVTSTPALEGALSGLQLVMCTDPTAPGVAVVVGEQAVDVSDAIREPQISATVSQISTNLSVRADLVDRQQAIIRHTVTAGRGIVVEGRDITTVVAPDAAVRVLLTASEEARLARRSAQDSEAGATQDADATRDQVLRRDAQDSTVAAFTTAADGVITLDSSDLDFDQTVDALATLVAAGGTP